MGRAAPENVPARRARLPPLRWAHASAREGHSAQERIALPPALSVSRRRVRLRGRRCAEDQPNSAAVSSIAMLRMTPCVWIPRALLTGCAVAPFAILHLACSRPRPQPIAPATDAAPALAVSTVASTVAAAVTSPDVDSPPPDPPAPVGVTEPVLPRARPVEIARCKARLASVATFLKTHRACTSDSHCTVVTTGCGLGGACGAGIAKSGEAGFREVLNRFENDACSTTLPPLPCPSCPPPPAAACRGGSCQP